MDTANHQPQTANRLFRVVTFGCKINQCDTAGMSQELARRGWRPSPPGATPELYLVNTCTVTGRADQQARQTIRRLAREHPGVPIWVTGCYAQRAPEELAALPGVQGVLGNREKTQLAEIIAAFQRPLPHGAATPPSAPSPLRGEGWGGGGNVTPPPLNPPLTGEEGKSICSVGAFAEAEPFQPWRAQSFPGHTRAWLKIQEGCSHHCSYCIVPKVRGPRRSWPPAEVAAALNELAAAGYQEVVLTGIDLGQYGRDLSPATSLADLVRRLRTDNLPLRVRLSSLEPQEITGTLLTELASWRDFCPHFHLPLQSGAAQVLAAMNRPYRPEAFRDLVLDLAGRFPEAALGLDVLVGFPGETESDFEATRDLVASLPVTYLHVFPFSPRPGTPAAQLKPVPGREVQRRAGLLRELGRMQKQAFLLSQLNQVREVLVEGPAPPPGWLQGLSDNYLRVIFPGPAAWRNRRLLVRFLKLQEEMLVGEIVADRAITSLP
ncbi:MAG: tRNA (N(6)-L-threonylcarbamoyladenosine(37)-C(2))-methylthiotransferase MtaB [Deltaproteobacteria bacterium]|nr:tRNA (N(6)-L-threonylcarbamoyladenosine(37)-C(2))-methylthiotransferase MtaB [Deltaproteobacteria bacterium]